MNIKDYEGLKVIRRCGDRDRVGDIVEVKDVQENGECKFLLADFCYGNISEIQMDLEHFDGSKYNYQIIKK